MSVEFVLKVNKKRLADLVDCNPEEWSFDQIVDSVENMILSQRRRIVKLERLLNGFKFDVKALGDE